MCRPVKVSLILYARLLCIGDKRDKDKGGEMVVISFAQWSELFPQLLPITRPCCFCIGVNLLLLVGRVPFAMPKLIILTDRVLCNDNKCHAVSNFLLGGINQDTSNQPYGHCFFVAEKLWNPAFLSSSPSSFHIYKYLSVPYRDCSLPWYSTPIASF